VGYLNDYIGKGPAQLEAELLGLIKRYNKIRGTYLVVYASTVNKPGVPNILDMDDYYTLYDLLRGKDTKNLDLYLETPGGIIEAAEEIARYLHDHFEHIAIVISGLAKSAGTILTFAGDDIMMTESGSLGPIDAQLKIGRMPISAIDYIEWVEEKKKEADKNKKLNPFDAITVSQITPGELKCVFNSVQYAKDLVVEWLTKYKFKAWDFTETRKIKVTDEIRRLRAEEIAELLTNRGKWRSHGRPIKIKDLQTLLKIIRIDDTPDLAEIVYRIQTVIRLLFDSTNIYKIFAHESGKIFKTAIQRKEAVQIPLAKKNIGAVDAPVNCEKCGKQYLIHFKFENNPAHDIEIKRKGAIPYPKNGKLTCSCGFEIDLSGMKNDIELEVGKKTLL